MIIDPRHLIQLHLIVELGSFHAAAESLNLTQPGLSRTIRLLESRLGVQLLVRGKHGSFATHEGKTLASYGRKLYEMSLQAAATGTALQKGDVGELRIGAAFYLANELLAEPVSRFLATRDKASIRITPGATPHLLEALDNGQFDLVIGGTQMLAPDHGLSFEPLLSNTLDIVARVDHPLARLESVTLAQLRSYRWVACLEQDPLRRDVDAGMASLGLMRDAIALETASMELVSQVLEHTDFLSMLPSPLASSRVTRGHLSRIKLDNTYALRPIGVAYRADTALSPLINAFLKELRRWAQAQHCEND